MFFFDHYCCLLPIHFFDQIVNGQNQQFPCNSTRYRAHFFVGIIRVFAIFSEAKFFSFLIILHHYCCSRFTFDCPSQSQLFETLKKQCPSHCTCHRSGSQFVNICDAPLYFGHNFFRSLLLAIPLSVSYKDLIILRDR